MRIFVISRRELSVFFPRYDSTGMFHWTPARPIEECIIVRSTED